MGLEWGWGALYHTYAFIDDVRIANSLKPTSIYDFKLKILVRMCLFALNFVCVSCSESFLANM